MNSTENDIQHLNLLGILHYVLGGMVGVFACVPLIHVSMGWAMVFGNPERYPGGAPSFVGFIFIFTGLLFFTLMLSLAVCLIISGRRLRQRRKLTFSLVVACVGCMFMPIGTVLGVFTIIVLSKDSVKAAFNNAGEINN